MYNSSYSVQTLPTAEAAATVAMVSLIIVFISAAIGYVASSFLISRIFKKAGIKQSIAWIPIYNTWTLLEMGDQKGYWAPLALVPGVNIASAIFFYIALYHIGKKFGKEDWFVALAIFVVPIWFIILAFDKSTWNGGGTANQNMNQNVNAMPAYTPPIQNTESSNTVQPVAPAPAAEQPVNNINQQ